MLYPENAHTPAITITPDQQHAQQHDVNTTVGSTFIREFLAGNDTTATVITKLFDITSR